MPWIESHTQTERHRKTIMAAIELDMKPVHLSGHMHSLWHHALEQQEDGDLSEWGNHLIARLAEYDGDPDLFVAVLQKHRWLDGYLIHDWLDYAGRYLESKYQSSNHELLKRIWKVHGRSYKKGKKKQMPSGWFKIRRAVLERDEHKCHYCGKPARSVDHVIPRSEGGSDELSNLVSACIQCNISRNNKTRASRSFDERKSLHPKGKVRLSPLISSQVGSVSEEGGCKGGDFGPTQMCELYHERLPRLPKVREITNGRADKIRSRLKEHPEREFWVEVFDRAAASGFIHGDGPRGWVADFEWFVANDKNAIKVLEGRYDTRAAHPRTKADEVREKTRQALNWRPPNDRQ